MYTAVLMSYNGLDEHDPSRTGFESEELAVLYIEMFICRSCLLSIYNEYYKNDEYDIKDAGAWLTACGAEWFINEYDDELDVNLKHISNEEFNTLLIEHIKYLKDEIINCPPPVGSN